MLNAVAIENYRSIRRMVIPLDRLTVISGANASGKSNAYRALRLLASAAAGNIAAMLSREGGIISAMWAGPRSGSQDAVQLRLGFAGEDFGYSIALGYPPPARSAFARDPEVKREAIWHGAVCRPASMLVDRNRALLRVRDGKSWKIASKNMTTFDTIFSTLSDPLASPETLQLRQTIQQWRFYDHFRTDADSPARLAHVGTRTPVLAHDGNDLAAALQTIIEIGDEDALRETIEDAFPEASLSIRVDDEGRFAIDFTQKGLFRPLSAGELSDGTLRFFLLVAALLTPRPPALMILNEPETSLHPDLLPALGRLIIRATSDSQIWVVTHSNRLIATLEEDEHCSSVVLEKTEGETVIAGQRSIDEPPWHWPE